MSRLTQHLVSRMLTPVQKETRMSNSGDLIDVAYKDSKFPNIIITGNERWRFFYDSEITRQSTELKEPLCKKFRVNRNRGNDMLDIFFPARILSIISSYVKSKQWIKKCTLASFVAFGMRPEGNTPKNEEPAVGFNITTMLQHTGRFLSRIS